MAAEETVPDVREAREKESKKAPPNMSESRRARRPRGAKPGQEKRGAAAGMKAFRGSLTQKKDCIFGKAARVHDREIDKSRQNTRKEAACASDEATETILSGIKSHTLALFGN